MTLKPKDRKPPALGPVARADAVHLVPTGDETGLTAVIRGDGLRDRDNDGLVEHDTTSSNMWLGAWTTNQCIEFNLARPVSLAAIEVWNFNGDWQTTNGVRAADVSVSADGKTWQTVLGGAQFAEAEGTADYDEPTVLKLNAPAMAQKVRFENLVPISASGKIGLSAVVFHEEATNGKSGTN